MLSLKKFLKLHPVKNWAISILILPALLLLTSCAQSPTVLTKTEIREVEKVVVQPISEELLQDHYPSIQLSETGKLSIAEISNYLNELRSVIEKYRADKAALKSLGGEE